MSTECCLLAFELLIQKQRVWRHYRGVMCTCSRPIIKRLYLIPRDHATLVFWCRRSWQNSTPKSICRVRKFGESTASGIISAERIDYIRTVVLHKIERLQSLKQAFSGAAVTDVFTRATLASAGISCRRVSVCPSVRHKSVFYWNGYM